MAFWESNNFYEKQELIIEYQADIESEFWDLIDDFLKADYKTEEHRLFKEVLKSEAQKLKHENKNKFEVLINYISEKRAEYSWDDKMQLLELWAMLRRIPNSSYEQNETYSRKDFTIVWWKSWKYQLTDRDSRYLWNNEYHIKLEMKKKQNDFVSYWRNIEFKIRYIPESWVIEYIDNYWRKWVIIIDHKTSIVERWNINKWHFHKETYEKWNIVPANFKINWKNITLYLKFYSR